MNNQRRKEIKKIIDRLDIIKNEIEQICNDEEDYHDNIPENLQDSDRAMSSEEAIDNLNEVLENIENAIDNLESAME
jgi:chaperonin cofactor prefoldin